MDMVYLLQYSYYHEGNCDGHRVRGVFGTKEKALERAREQAAKFILDEAHTISEDGSSLTQYIPSYKETRVWVAMPWMVE